MADPSMAMTCPAPFLDESHYPTTGGYVPGRFCGPFTDSLYCCLPCPLQQWVYSEDFQRKANVAYWFNVPGFLAQGFLLASFLFLREEESRGHYMSVGLCVALMMLELSFIIPLGIKPDKCFNDVTPNDMHSNLTCAWSGALLQAGSMAAVIWILLRSIWTHMRVCWDIKHTPMCMYIAHAIGWGLPLVFLTISLSVTGVSYRMGGTCIPNPENSIVTWFGWLITFGWLAAIIQFITTGFCVAIYARQLLRGNKNTSITDTQSSTAAFPTTPSSGQALSSQFGGSKRLAWRRVHKVLLMQWRSIVLSLLIIIECLFFGTVYVAQAKAGKNAAKPENVPKIQAWIMCLVENPDDKAKCLHLAEPLGIGEDTVAASFVVASLIGVFTFILMFRWSMLTGWCSLIRHPRRARTASAGSVGDFVLIHPRDEGANAKDGNGRTGVLPSPEKEHLNPPEPGDVSTRHETTSLFDAEESDVDSEKDGVKRKGKLDRDDVV